MAGYVIKKDKGYRTVLYNGEVYSTEEEAEQVLLKLSDEDWYVEEVTNEKVNC